MRIFLLEKKANKGLFQPIAGALLRGHKGKCLGNKNHVSTQVIKEVKGTNDYTLMGQQLDLLTKNIVAHKNYVQYTTMVHSKVWIINTMIKTKK